jgi:hypothetical protein
MVKKVKLFVIDEKPYLASLDTIEVGDKAIVTVGGQYPSIVECKSEMELKLITESKLKLTQPFKLFLEPDKIDLNETQIQNILEGDGVLEVEIDNNTIKYNI